MNTRLLGGLFAILALVLLCGCSSQPSEQQGRDAFQQSLAGQVGTSPFTLTSFSKVDGQAQEIAGIHVYRMMYEATVTYPSGLRTECLRNDGQFRGFDNYMKGVNCMMSSADGALTPQPPGAVVKYRGEIGFQKTERRWNSSVTISSSEVDARTAAMEQEQAQAAERARQAQLAAQEAERVKKESLNTHFYNCYFNNMQCDDAAADARAYPADFENNRQSFFSQWRITPNDIAVREGRWGPLPGSAGSGPDIAQKQ